PTPPFTDDDFGSDLVETPSNSDKVYLGFFIYYFWILYSAPSYLFRLLARLARRVFTCCLAKCSAFSLSCCARASISSWCSTTAAHNCPVDAVAWRCTLPK